MAMSPLIGIEVDLDVTPAGRRYAKCYESYLDAVASAGGTPVLVAPHGSGACEALLGLLHGLVIPGGDDLCADEWGETQRPCPRFVQEDARRLAHGKDLLRRWLALGRPFLGVCYGAQLLNLARGGTMVQDVPDEVAGALWHATGTHPIEVLPGTLLHRLVGARLEVNSRHHQANREPGQGLRVSARSADGVVEAIEGTAPDEFLVGVQWHPEDLPGPAGAGLFRALVEAAAESASRAAREARGTALLAGG